MEHRNSTVLASTSSLARRMDGLLGTVAHEFFHAWNVERIRPATLEPFDFEAANVSRELWFGEGFTSYYDGLSLWRAGLLEDADFVRSLGGSVSYVTGAPGRRYFSPVEMSMQAPFVDAAVSVDPTNRTNTFISYYTWGSVIALGLDLTLRTAFPGVSLDDLMREMWAAHGTPEVPYTVEDVEAALGRVTGDAAFAGEFFDRYVRGRDVPDFRSLMAAAGISLSSRVPGEATLGAARLRAGEGGVEIATNTRMDSPLYRAGLDRGDRIVTLGGRDVRTPEDVEAVVAAHAPGEALRVTFESRGRGLDATAVLAEEAGLRATLDPAPSDQERAFLAAWKEGGPR